MADLGSPVQTPKFGAIPYLHAADGVSVVSPLLRRLDRFATLSLDEMDQVRALAPLRRRWRSGSTLPANETTAQFMLSGWACIQRVLRDGRRQIFDFILPGEGFGLGALSKVQSRQTVLALTPVEMAPATPDP